MPLTKCCSKIGIFSLQENVSGFLHYSKEVLHVINHSVLLLCKLSFVCKKIEDIFLAALFPDDEVLFFSSVLKDQ